MTHSLNRSTILAHMPNTLRQCISQLTVLESVDSTNNYLLRQVSSSFQSKQQGSWICLADMQTAGRGRLGRAWQSPPNAGLYLSCLWPHTNTEQLKPLASLTLMVGVSVVQALKSCYGNAIDQCIKLKWPNDIVWEGEKLGGILIESTHQLQPSHSTVIGIGINCQLPNAIKQSIEKPVTDLASILQKAPDRNTLANEILTHLLKLLLHAKEPAIQQNYLNQWRERDILKGQRIQITIAKKRLMGIACGITDQGALILNDNGTMHTVMAGEATLAMY